MRVLGGLVDSFDIDGALAVLSPYSQNRLR